MQPLPVAWKDLTSLFPLLALGEGGEDLTVPAPCQGSPAVADVLVPG